MNQVKKTIVTFNAPGPFELEPGIFLPAGIYHGTSTTLGFARMGQVEWTPPEYKIELSAAELERMGMSNIGAVISIEYDITGAVKDGKLKLS